MKSGIFGIPVLLLASCGCSIGQFESTRSETGSAAPGNLEVVEVNTFNGRIDVIAHDSSDVSYQIDYSARGQSQEEADANCEQLTCTVTEGDRKLTFVASDPNDTWSSSAAMVLKVPADCQLILQTSNGRIDVGNTSGKVTASTSNGRVTITNVVGDQEIDTSNGRVEIVNCDGNLQLSTSNGRISVSGRVTGNSKIRTSNGQVRLNLDAGAPCRVSLKTSNGSITVNGPHQMVNQDEDSAEVIIGETASEDSAAIGQLNVGTSNGSVTVEVQQQADEQIPEDRQQ